jgi:hypothetical protein
MKTVKDRYRHQKIYHFVYHELVMAARYRGVVTYQELAKLMGLPMSGNYMSMEIGHILGEISDDEVAYGRPMLSALAVGVSGEPGDGFFNLAKELDRLQDDSKEARQRFWEQEKQAVYEAWKVELQLDRTLHKD